MIDVKITRNKKFEVPFIKGERKVRVGWFRDAAPYKNGISVPSVAEHLEFKSPWPFMRPTVHQNESNYRELLKSLMGRAINAGQDPGNTLAQFGEKVKGDIQMTILSITSPPNKPSTAKRKGFNKPLIDTGHMIGTIQSRVDDEE